MLVLLMMVMASCVVDDWQVVGWLGLDSGCVGFWICSQWKEGGCDKGGGRETQIRERREMVLDIKYIILMYCIER